MANFIWSTSNCCLELYTLTFLTLMDPLGFLWLFSCFQKTTSTSLCAFLCKLQGTKVMQNKNWIFVVHVSSDALVNCSRSQNSCTSDELKILPPESFVQKYSPSSTGIFFSNCIWIFGTSAASGIAAIRETLDIMKTCWTTLIIQEFKGPCI